MSTEQIEYDPTGTFAVSHDEDGPNHYRVDPPARPGQPAPAPAGRAAVPTPATPATPGAAAPADVDDQADDDEPEWLDDDDEDDDEPGGKAAKRTGMSILATAAGLVVFHFAGPFVLVASAVGGAVLYAGGRQILSTGTPEGTRHARRAARNGRATTPRLAGAGGGRVRRAGSGLPKMPKLTSGRASRAAKATKSTAPKATKARTTGARSSGLPKLPKGRAGSILPKGTKGRGGSGLPKGPKGRAGSILPKLRAGGPKPTSSRRGGLKMPGLPGLPGRRRGAAGGPRSRMLAGQPRPTSRGRKATSRTSAARTSAARTSAATPPRPMNLRELLNRSRTNRRARAAARQQHHLNTYWPTLGRELRTAGGKVGHHLFRRPARWMGRTLIARPARSIARRARIRARWARTYLAPHAWQKFIRWAVPRWMHRLRVVARRHGFRRALVASMVAAFAAVATFFRTTLPGLVWPTDKPATPVRRQVVKPVIDRHDDEQDSDAPIGVTPGTEPTRPRPTPAARPRMATTTARNRPPVYPAGGRQQATNPHGGNVSHPALTPITEASYQQVALFVPLSIPDLHSYLNSQADAMLEREEIYHRFADKLAASFPGAADVYAFFYGIGTGYRDLASQAVDLHRAYRDMHKADIDRHERPRVNEERADLIKRGATRSALGDPKPAHPQHVRFNEVLRTYVLGYDPGVAYAIVGDDVSDLIFYLAAQPEAFLDLAVHAKTFAVNLVKHHPVDTDLHAYYWQFAHGFAHLADQATELAAAYLRINDHDVRRRMQPRTNEAWADFSNQQMTH